MRTRAILMATAIAAVAMPGVALAQQAASPEPEWFWVDAIGDTVYMFHGSPPAQRPTEPVEAWSWQFYRIPKSLQPSGSVDAIGQQVRIDCAGGTSEPQIIMGYLGEAVIAAERVTGPAERPAPDTMASELILVACEPGVISARTFPNFGSARAAARAHFDGGTP